MSSKTFRFLITAISIFGFFALAIMILIMVRDETNKMQFETGDILMSKQTLKTYMVFNVNENTANAPIELHIIPYPTDNQVKPTMPLNKVPRNQSFLFIKNQRAGREFFVVDKKGTRCYDGDVVVADKNNEIYRLMLKNDNGRNTFFINSIADESIGRPIDIPIAILEEHFLLAEQR